MAETDLLARISLAADIAKDAGSGSSGQEEDAPASRNVADIPVRADEGANASISQTINSALLATTPFSAPVTFSSATRQLFLRAWTLAEKQHHNQISEDHLLVALLSNDEEIKDELGRIANEKPLALHIGALVRVARLEEVAAPVTIKALLPTENLVKWIGEAGRYATNQNRAAQLKPIDLVGVFDSQDCDPNVHAMLKRRLGAAAKAGTLRSQLEKTLQASESTRQTAGFHRAATLSSLNELKGKINHLATQDTTGQDITEQDDIDTTHLSRLEGQITAVENSIGGLSTDHLPGIAHLVTKVDRRTTEIRAGLPRPPGAGFLLFSIAGVLGLGIALGVALNDPSHLGTAYAEVIRQVSTVATDWK